MFDMLETGGRISQIRKKCGMTQAELAEKVGVSCQAVSSWERGITMPDISNLKRIADVLGVTVDYILDDTDITEDDWQKDNHTVTDFDIAKEAYESGNIGVFCELVETFNSKTLSQIFETAYKDTNIGIVAELVDLVSQEDLKNCALYAYKHNIISLIAEITDALSEENKLLLKRKAIADKRIDFLSELTD